MLARVFPIKVVVNGLDEYRLYVKQTTTPNKLLKKLRERKLVQHQN